MRSVRHRVFGVVMFWTIATTVFAWLPLVRIIGRPEGYHWGVLGLRGSGTDGPFWVFILLTAWAVSLLFTAHRGPRRLFYALLLAWHLTFTGVILSGVVLGGAGATMQGQGLHWSAPLWVIGSLCVVFLALVVAWIMMDHGAGGSPGPVRWRPGNTRRLTLSLVVLGVALGFFAAGTNYNWVTAVAIALTIAHWILLALSFEALPAVSPERLALRRESSEGA